MGLEYEQFYPSSSNNLSNKHFPSIKQIGAYSETALKVSYVILKQKQKIQASSLSRLKREKKFNSQLQFHSDTKPY